VGAAAAEFKKEGEEEGAVNGRQIKTFNENERGGRQMRLMTNSHKAQSEELAAGGGRETAAKKPHNDKVPGTTRLLAKSRGRAVAEKAPSSLARESSSA